MRFTCFRIRIYFSYHLPRIFQRNGKIILRLTCTSFHFFALPLAFAGLHLVFAFPMIRRVLMLFSLYNVGLFIRTTVISFVA